MRWIAMLCALCALAIPASAQDAAPDAKATRAKALDDFTAYSAFLVANTNCSELNFNAEHLKTALYQSADALRWTEAKRRQEASELVRENTLKLQADPKAFCASARMMMTQYQKAGTHF